MKPDDTTGVVTHRSLCPRDMCPRLNFKALATDCLDQPVRDGQTYPGDGYYWCTRTLKPVGPDDELVDPFTCRPGRRCYEGIES